MNYRPLALIALVHSTGGCSGRIAGAAAAFDGGASAATAVGGDAGGATAAAAPTAQDGATPTAPTASLAYSFSKRIGHGQTDLAAFDAAGNLVIAGAIDGQYDSTVWGSDSSSDGGLYQPDAFVVQFDPSGRTNWTRRLVGPRIDALAITGDGSVILSTTPFPSWQALPPAPDAGPAMTTLVAFDPAGKPLWTLDTSLSQAASMGADFAGNLMIFTIDGTLAKLDPMGRTLWTRSEVAVFPSAAVNTAGEVAVLYSPSLDSTTSVLEEFSPSGQVMWSRTLTASPPFYPVIDLNPAGEVVIAGDASAATDLGGPVSLSTPAPPASDGWSNVVVARYAANGDYLWARQYNGLSITSGAIRFTPAGQIVLAGSFGKTFDLGVVSLSTSGTNLFLAEFDGSGNATFGRGFGEPTGGNSTNANLVRALAVGSGGQIAIGGMFAAMTVDFGGGPLQFSADPKATSPDDFNDPDRQGYDAFVADFAP